MAVVFVIFKLLMRMLKIKREDGWFVDTFEKTLPMSTYLIAFAVSNFKIINGTSTKYNILVEVAARPEAIDKNEGRYSLDAAMKILDYYTDYFEISYPLKKSSISLVISLE